MHMHMQQFPVDYLKETVLGDEDWYVFWPVLANTNKPQKTMFFNNPSITYPKVKENDLWRIISAILIMMDKMIELITMIFPAEMITLAEAFPRSFHKIVINFRQIVSYRWLYCIPTSAKTR